MTEHLGVAGHEGTQTTTVDGSDEAFLVVDDLTVKFPTHDGLVHAVSNLSYEVRLGETLGIVGESGSGKSVSSMALLGLHDIRRTRMTGSIRVNGREIVGAPNDEMRKLRGNEVAMIFQDPLSALHPFYRIGDQLIEAYRIHHRDANKKAARERALEMLSKVGIPQPARRIDDYPHQFSGGMRQRAMIAMSLINDPRLLIADEPTTALDVTVQAQILDLIQELQREFGSAIILITHDLGVIAEIADDTLVMYAGRCVERGPTKEVLTHPVMPYTWGLLGSIADVSSDTDKPLIPIPGTPPSLLQPPSGCSFHPRCTFKDRVEGNRCTTELPELVPAPLGNNHDKRCHLKDPESIYQEELKEEILG
jgi:peptide/nickel transport system ATP-binding protein